MTREEQLVQVKSELDEAQEIAVISVIDDENEHAMRKKYAETSILMQMDPYCIPRRELIYKIQIEDMGQSYMLGTVYEDLINNVGLYQWVEEQTGISAIVARELISIDANTKEVI